MVRKKIAVIGWYGHQNIGDEAFKNSFALLWPEWDFTFFNQVPDTSSFDAVIVGAGSFLDQPIKNIHKINKPLAFVGVGTNGFIHPDNQAALQRAKIVLSRSQNSTFVQCPDMVFAQHQNESSGQATQITVLVNDHFTPRANSKPWQLSAWEWFSVEMAQACDRMIAQYDLPIHFVPMCTNPHVDDRRAAAFVVSRMERKDRAFIQSVENETEFLKHIKNSKFVISQRLHGIIFSVTNRVPCVAISGHDKVRDLMGQMDYKSVLSYYGFNMESFTQALRDSENMVSPQAYSERAKDRWKDLSKLVMEKLFG